MNHRKPARIFALLVIMGALLAPLAQAQGPTPPPPPRGLRYEIDQPGMLPMLPGAQPQARAADQSSAPACAPWSQLTFASYRNQSDWEVYIANGDGAGQTRLTYHDGTDTAPKLNRGCTRIAYQSAQGPQYEVYAINPDGSSPASLSNHGAFDGLPCWSADGARIAFQTDRTGNHEIYVMNADGSGQTNLTNHPAYDGMPAWSPDGARIAFVSNRTGQYEVWAMNADGTGQTQVTHGVAWAEYPCWSPDGSKLAFSNDDNGDGFMDVDVVNADGTGFTHVAGHTTNVDYWYPAWSPDGEWIAYSRTELIYYQGQWYWTRSDIYAQGAPGYGHPPAALVASGYDWRPHWGTLDLWPPTSQVNSLPTYSRVSGLTISWSGQDTGPAGIKSYDVQYRDGTSGTWTDWQIGTSATSATFNGTGGHTYYFRSRARDWACHVEAWPGGDGDARTTLFTYVLTGIVHDNHGTPISNATVNITPHPLEDAVSDSSGAYVARLTATGMHMVTVSRSGYSDLPATTVGILEDKEFDFVLPPTDNIVQNGDFEADGLGASNWMAGGTITPTIVDLAKHTGGNSILFGQVARPPIFVDDDNNSGLEDGTRAHPYTTIQGGVSAAQNGDMVLVLPGTYTVASGNPIAMKSGVTIRGSGADVTSIVASGGGSVTLVVGADDGRLDGFSISNGWDGINCYGSSPMITNNIISGNYHGIFLSGSSAVIKNNVFINNEILISGGGHPTIVNNTVVGAQGIRFYSASCSPTVMNNIVVPGWSGGGIFCFDSTLYSPTISYNDVWNGSINCSSGTGNIFVDPLFMNSSQGPYHLQPGSPCIDAGNPDPTYNDYDGSRDDMGAYGGPNPDRYLLQPTWKHTWADLSPWLGRTITVTFNIHEITGKASKDSYISQVVTIPLQMNEPTLSFMYAIGSGTTAATDWFEVTVATPVSTTHLFSETTGAGKCTWAYLDEVSLGSAYPNLWVGKSSTTVPPGGGPVRYTITYGNLGGVPAQGVRLTDTLPAGVTFVAASAPPTSTAPLVWDVGDLAAGAGPFTIIVTGTVEASTPAWTTLANTVTIGGITPEADLDNNTAVAQTFVGYRLYLPLAAREW